MEIVNLTQHPATTEQKAEGVFDLEGAKLYILKEMLNFDELPDFKTVLVQAKAIAILAKNQNVNHAMIGGAPFLMPFLHVELIKEGITPLYAFSRRESVEETQPDGTVKKSSIFKHIGFVGETR